MYTKKQFQLLKDFADKNDALFDLGITTTDSFTGEIGEFIACQHFKLYKSGRSNKAVDGVAPNGERYQIKSKVVSTSSFSHTISNLQLDLFDKLVLVYFDIHYKLLKMLLIPVSEIPESVFRITKSNISKFDSIDKVKMPLKFQKALTDFANSFTALQENGIIRSRRIVGDIGEFYACKKLGLLISENQTEKGIDARHPNGLTFEVKTRWVYESDRRISEARRLNNLVGKTADYVIVVTLDRCFECSGMWIIPMKNIANPKSANLKIINSTPGVKNIIPSKISWLQNRESFQGFDTVISNRQTHKTIAKRKPTTVKPNQVSRPQIPVEESNKINIEQIIIATVLITLGLLIALIM
ncbi:hypothetical protein OA84_10625 [Kaistella solincola]|uniref:DUF6998 domain-containing protein n=1 Tax=Kaistella solincola TaxID=510955 RepID=A0ABR4ZNJ1_9FLAO|nr:hypothetical protein [Kaistella solincola]KIA82599.1 hypothetical protein OA84_10625 [Kaistella solincola]